MPPIVPPIVPPSLRATNDLVTRSEIQDLVGRAHLEKFGEEREAREMRFLEQRARDKA